MIHAIISDGRLYVRNQQGQIDEIESPFVKDKQDRAERLSSHSGWKQSSSGDGCFNSSVIWGGQSAAAAVCAFRFKDVVAAGEDTLYYILTNHTITGLFRYDLADGFETRLFHRNDLIECGMKQRGQEPFS